MESPKKAAHKEFPVIVEEDYGDDARDRYSSFYGRCLSLPCFRRGRLVRSPSPSSMSSSSSSFWDRIGSSRYDGRWWTPGLRVIKKIREWSELIAGPKWKTFIRRIRRKGGRPPSPGGGKLNYDLVDYSLNFDEGLGEHGDINDADDEFRRLRSFSVGYGRRGGGGAAEVGEKKGKEAAVGFGEA
ncbi:hypothetical protein MLD38_032731 [Melastoma candidum]|uniref:Uncharacterized protein n=1 Tax=Melastoma candidum TaxID=119954 RepID=A0ACB9M528_9MYRT|nr:hypothetical protein MLD38_032731 [Melastoma candidum]